MQPAHFEVYNAALSTDQWRWRFVARNGKTTCASTDYYSEPKLARASLRRFCETLGIPSGRVKFVQPD